MFSLLISHHGFRRSKDHVLMPLKVKNSTQAVQVIACVTTSGLAVVRPASTFKANRTPFMSLAQGLVYRLAIRSCSCAWATRLGSWFC
jgi:hypothetical protein